MFAVGRPENKAVGIEETTKCGTAVSQVPVSLHLTKRKSQISNDGDIESIPYMGSAVSIVRIRHTLNFGGWMYRTGLSGLLR